MMSHSASGPALHRLRPRHLWMACQRHCHPPRNACKRCSMLLRQLLHRSATSPRGEQRDRLAQAWSLASEEPPAARLKTTALTRSPCCALVTAGCSSKLSSCTWTCRPEATHLNTSGGLTAASMLPLVLTTTTLPAFSDTCTQRGRSGHRGRRAPVPKQGAQTAQWARHLQGHIPGAAIQQRRPIEAVDRDAAAAAVQRLPALCARAIHLLDRNRAPTAVYARAIAIADANVNVTTSGVELYHVARQARQQNGATAWHRICARTHQIGRVWLLEGGHGDICTRRACSASARSLGNAHSWQIALARNQHAGGGAGISAMPTSSLTLPSAARAHVQR